MFASILAFYYLELRELQSRHPVHCTGSLSIPTMIFCTLYNDAYMEVISFGIYAYMEVIYIEVIYIEVIYIEIISFGIVAHDHLPSSPLLSMLQAVVLQHTLLKHWPTQAVHLQSKHIKRSKDPISDGCHSSV